MLSASTLVRDLWERFEARDFAGAAELLCEDFVCEWPQSRERIRGRDHFIAVNAHYPGDWHIRVVRVIAEGNQVASEVHVSLDGRTDVAASFFELKDGKLWRLTEYWPESYPAQAWRERWVERF